jgi:hypothetical protein
MTYFQLNVDISSRHGRRWKAGADGKVTSASIHGLVCRVGAVTDCQFDGEIETLILLGN